MCYNSDLGLSEESRWDERGPSVIVPAGIAALGKAVISEPIASSGSSASVCR